MEKVYQYIVENTASGKMNREIAIELLKMLKQETETFQPIAIIGIAARLPLADNPKAFWNIIRRKTDCIRQLPQERRLEIEKYLRFKKVPVDTVKYAEIAYLEEIDKFDHSFFRISPKEASLMDPNQRLFLETAWSAIEDAGYGGKKLTGSKTGVYLGFSGKSSYEQLASEAEPAAEAGAAIGNIPAIISSRIAYLLDLKGPALLIDTACSSSLVAVHLACQGIRNGDCDLALAGGVKITLVVMAADSKLGIESSDGRTHTFDDSSDGTGSGEGVVALLLKPLDKARKDNDHIYAVIKGSAINQDGSSIGITAPNVTAQENVIMQAWKNAGIAPETIAYLEAHGTGTKLGDPIEIEGIRRAFQRHTSKKQFCAIGSLKSNIGHLDNAAGIAGLLKAILALKYREIPPTLHFQSPNRKIPFEDSPVYVSDRLSLWESGDFPRRSGVSAFGLSGTNCHVVLEEAPEILWEDNTAKRPQIFTISAKSAPALQQCLRAYREFLDTEAELNLTRICYTANTGRGHYNYRLAIIINSAGELRTKVTQLLEADRTMLESPDILSGFHQMMGANQKSNETGYLTSDQKIRIDQTAAETLAQFTRDLTEAVYRERLAELARLYILGADIEWEKIYMGQKIPKLSLPTYAFERNRCWVEIPEAVEPERRYYVTRWEPKTPDISGNTPDAGLTLVLNHELSVGGGAAAQLIAEGQEVILVGYGPEFKKIDDNHYEIDNSKESFAKLLQAVKERKLARIILPAGKWHENKDWDEPNDSHPREIHGLFNLIQAISGHLSREALEIVIIAQCVHRVTGREAELNPEAAMLFGLGKIVNLENPRLKCRCLDIDGTIGIPEIMAELRGGSNSYLVAYREGGRYLETIRPLSLETIPDNEVRLEQDGVYLITGGTGGIGLEFGKYLAGQDPVNIALINRSPMPKRDTWDELLKTGTDLKQKTKIHGIREIESRGAKVTCYRADVSRRREIEPVLDEIRGKYGKIKGIIHGAGINTGDLIINETMESLDQVLAAKVTGTRLLDQLTRSDDLDFLILFSSAITVIGGIGAGAYTAANAYLDAYAGYRNLSGKRTLTIHWPTWKETGMSAGMPVNEDKQLFKLITPGQAMSAFEQVFRKEIPNVIIGELNYASPVFRLKDGLSFRLSAELDAEIQAFQTSQPMAVKPKKAYEVQIIGKDEAYTETETKLARIWAEVLGLKQISIFDNFYELGGDSILAVQVIANLPDQQVEVKDLFRYPTIDELSRFLDSLQPPVISKAVDELSVTDQTLIPGFLAPIPGVRQRQILENVLPFNDVLYKDCFYNAFFPMVRHFNRDLHPFLADDWLIYQYLPEKQGIKIDINYLSSKATERILNEIGIKVHSKLAGGNLTHDLIEALAAGKLVILRVDCFYEPIRYDTYQEIHWEHWLLVYGYDQTAQVFYILEHDDLNSLTYKPQTIGYQDLYQAYQGYLKNFQKGESIPSYYEFSVTENDFSNGFPVDPKPVFRQNLSVKKVEVLNGLNALLSFQADLQQLVTDEAELKKNLDEMNDTVNRILKAKYGERYQITILLDAPANLLSILDKIIAGWNYLKITLEKYKYSNVYRPGDFQTAIVKLEQIYQLEHHFYEELFS